MRNAFVVPMHGVKELVLLELTSENETAILTSTSSEVTCVETGQQYTVTLKDLGANDSGLLTVGLVPLGDAASRRLSRGDTIRWPRRAA